MGMFNLIRPDIDIDFVGKRVLWLSVSTLALVGSLVLLFTKGLNYGIDFEGGAEIQVKFHESMDIGTVRTTLTKGGLEEFRLQQTGESGQNEFMVRMASGTTNLSGLGEKVKTILTSGRDPNSVEITRVDVVGPAAGSSLKKRGFQSMFFALLVILIYVGIRFDARYAPGAVLALVHDSVICLGVFVITGKQFDLTILAAILALIGYSNNDTIIVYDRVREMTHLHPDWTIEHSVNRAMNETLGRTFNTAFSTFLVVFFLWLMGGPAIENFAFAILVGIVVGTYSSIFVASSAIITVSHWKNRRDARARTSTGAKKRQYHVPPAPTG